MHGGQPDRRVHPRAPIKIKNRATLRDMVLGIIVYENGSNPYAAAMIHKSVRLALECSSTHKLLLSAAGPVHYHGICASDSATEAL